MGAASFGHLRVVQRKRQQQGVAPRGASPEPVL
jgi:hypothetical protein